MKLIYDSREFKIIGDDKFSEIKEALVFYLDLKIYEILSFFNIKEINKFSIYLYSDKEMFCKVTKYPYKLGPLGGAFNFNGVIVYANLDEIDRKKLYSAIAHEIIHLLYLKYVEEIGIKNRTIWFEEGLSQNLSGEKDYLTSDEALSDYLVKNIYDESKIVPSIDYLCKHGNRFGEFIDEETDKYNGYVWSYLMVRYLLTIIPKEYFDQIMRSKLELDVIGKVVVDSTYNYYKKKVKIKE